MIRVLVVEQGMGLVDQLGGMPTALLKAQELADLPRDRDAPILLASFRRIVVGDRMTFARSHRDEPLIHHAFARQILRHRHSTATGRLNFVDRQYSSTCG